MNNKQIKKLIYYEWLGRYLIYTLSLFFMFYYLYNTFDSLYFKIVTAISFIIILYLHYDTFNILFKVFMKEKSINMGFKKYSMSKDKNI